MDFQFILYFLELFGIAVAAYYAYKCYGILLNMKKNTEKDKKEKTEESE